MLIGLAWVFLCPWLVGLSLPPLEAERFACGAVVHGDVCPIINLGYNRILDEVIVNRNRIPH